MSTPSLNIRRVLGDETDSDPNIQLLPPKKPSTPSKYSVKDEIHIFDGKNTPQNISVYGFLLGMVCSAGIMFAVLSDSNIPQFGIFLAALSLFHFLEYIATALFNADKLSLDCKYQIILAETPILNPSAQPISSITVPTTTLHMLLR